MIITKIIFYYIIYSIKLGTKPWRFSQFNANYFNEKKGIFSKYEIEENIPHKWKLKNILLKSNYSVERQKEDILSSFSLPVFLKPEWGQNAHGILLAKKENELEKYLKQIKQIPYSYICQESSDFKNEYEILYTRDLKTGEILLHDVIQSLNNQNIDYPINGIHSKTNYKSLIDKFNLENKDKIKKYINEIGEFSVGRIGLKSDSIEAIISGNFKIFEINIFIPMMLSLFDESLSKKERNNRLKIYIKSLVKITKDNSNKDDKAIFFRKIIKHYKIKLHHNKTFMKIKKIIYSFIEKKFLSGCSDYNGLKVRKSCRSKKQAREMFAQNNIPHAKGKIFYNPFTAYKFVKKHGFPIVLKPNVGGFSRGSHFPITNYKDFWKAMFLVKLWWPSSVVEQYLLGKNYRVVTTAGEVDLAMERSPAFIIGDGIKTIGCLIDEENKIRKQMKLLPIIHTIKKDGVVKKYIKKMGYNFQTILKKSEKIYLYHRVSLAPGGINTTIDTSTITPKNKEIFLKILNLFNSNIFGIDVIMEKGIDIDFDKQKCIFLEVNSRPYLKMHSVPRYGEVPDMKKLYAKLDKLEVDNRGVF